MPHPERRPLHYPPQLPSLFTEEELVRRLSRQCMIGQQSRVLLLGAGLSAAARFLAAQHGPELVVADPDPEALERVKAELDQAALGQRAHFQEVDPQALPFGEREFSSIWVQLGALCDLRQAAASLRLPLVLKGRVCLQWPVRVGRELAAPAVRWWEERLGQRLLAPRECLQILEQQGYEPQTVECLDDAALGAFYHRLEAQLADAPAADLAEEVSTFRAQGGRSQFSFAVMVVRRKEPGEKPPPSRAE